MTQEKTDFQYFCEEAGRFRELMGQVPFWRKPQDERDGWFAGLFYCLIKVSNEFTREEDARASQMFTAIADDYARRTAFVLFNGLPKAA